MFVCAEWVAIDDIAKAGDSIMYAHILLLTDGSELSKMAIREGVDLGESSGSPSNRRDRDNAVSCVQP